MSKAGLWITTGVVLSAAAVAFFTAGQPISSLADRERQSAQPPMTGTTTETLLRMWAVKTVIAYC
jgi:hypothetical protein